MNSSKKHYYEVSLSDLGIGDIFYSKNLTGFRPHKVVSVKGVPCYRYFLNGDITGTLVGASYPMDNLVGNDIKLYKPDAFIILVNFKARDIFTTISDNSDNFYRKMVVFKEHVDREKVNTTDYSILVQVCRLLQWHTNLCTTTKAYGFAINEDALAMAKALLKGKEVEKQETKKSLIKTILNKIFK